MGLGLLTTLLLLAGLVPLQGQTTFTNSTTITIPSGGTAPITPSPYPSNIAVSGMTGTVSKVTVTLSNMTVNSPDLDMMLVAPDGKKLVFLSDSGNGTAISGVTITLDDAAANQAPAVGGGAWTNGSSYRPANNNTGDTFPSPAPSYNGTTESASGVNNASATGTLALFNGITPNGTWSLYVVDDVPDTDARSIGGWSITITTAVSNLPTTTVLTSSVNPTFTSGAGSSTTLTATVTSGGNPVTLGSVTFLNGATTIASNVPLNASGQASTSLSIATEGLFTISANYSGATGFGTSSGSLTQEVNNRTTVSGNLFCNPGAVTISPSSNPYPQKIFVTGLSGTVSTVKVRLNGLTHSFPNDIDALLVAPDTSKKMQIISDTGATGNIILDDTAANQLTSTTTAGGTFRPTDLSGAGNETFPAPAPAGPYSVPAPTGGATLNSTYAGIAPNGTWSLYLIDDVPGAESASMSGGYCLDFTTTADLLTTTTVTSSADPASVGQNVTFTATVRRSDNNALVTSGTVTFQEGAATLAGPTALNGSGQASFSTSSLSEGFHTISANYNGVAGSFNVSSGTVTIQVDTATTVNGKVYCNPGGITNTSGTSPTAPQYPSRILVSSLAGSISTVTATFNGMIQGFPADFDMMLVGPNANQNFVLFSDAGTGVQSGTNITLSDAAGSALPTGALSSGTFRPTSYDNASDTFAAPAPSTNIQHAAPVGSATFSSIFGGTNPNGYWSLFVTDDTPGTTWQIGSWCLTFTNTPPDLTISKTHSGNFTQGQTGATYSITVTNDGPGSTAGTVSVVDTLPAGLTATSIVGTGWSCTLGTLTCTRSDALDAGNSYPAITLTVNVAGNATSPLINSATVSGSEDNTTSNNTANDSTTIVAVGDLTVSKTHSGNFTQGQTGATYTITVTNSGTGSTSGTVTVVDTLPAGLTATGITGTGWSCTLGTLTCTRSDVLSASSSYPAITLTVNVSASAAASVTNSVAVSGGGEVNTSNNSASDVTTINGVADLTVSKSHSGNFTQGQTGATYTITVTNSGTGSTSGTVTVVDTLPAGLTATGITGTGWSCTLGTLTCTRSDVLSASSSYPAITLTVNVSASAAASVTNSVAVSGGGEVNTSNNSASDVTTINGVADLTVSKSHSGNFTQGQTGATYTITVTNSGTGSTSGTVTVVDTLPAGLTATGITGTGWSCTLGTLTCTRSDVLSASSSYPAITLTVNVSASAAASVTNSVAVSGGGEVNTSNNSASDVTTINGVADLTVSKSHSGNFTQGQTGATYTITVTNSGTGSTSGTVTVVDTLPAGLTATGITGTGWSCTLGTLTCTRSDALSASSSYPAITLTVNVSASAAASVTNSVAVSGGGEVNTSNNSASDVTTINGVADLTVSKSHSGNFTQGQTGATYTITVTNSGTGSTSGTVTVVDTLPAGLTATGITGTGWSCTLGTLTCTRSDVLSASSSYPAITLTVNVSASAAASVTNSVAVSGGGETNTSNNSASDVTTINSGTVSITVGTVPAGLAFTVNGTPYTSSQTLNFTNGQSVTIATSSPQAGVTGEQYVFQSWSDSGAISHTISASAGATFTATFQRQTQLTTQVTPSGSGSVSPSGGFFNDSQGVQLTATPANSCFAFGSWSGNAPGGLVNMSTPQTVTATFSSLAATNVSGQVTVVLGGIRLNRATNRYVQTVTLTNAGTALANVNLVLDGLSANATLFGPSGVTGCTSPAGQGYRAIGALLPGVPVQVNLEFTNPTNGAIGYTPRIVAGTGLLP